MVAVIAWGSSNFYNNRRFNMTDYHTMRTIGHRKERPITFSATAFLLEEGARFNGEIHRLPTGNATLIPKGVSHFKTHEDANRHQLDCLVDGMVRTALERALEVFRQKSEDQ